MRALENLREEHQKELIREKEQVDFERKCAEEWVNDLREFQLGEDSARRTCSFVKALERPRAESATPGDGASTVATTGGGDAHHPGNGSTTKTTSRTDTSGHTEPATETGSETGHSA